MQAINPPESVRGNVAKVGYFTEGRLAFVDFARAPKPLCLRYERRLRTMACLKRIRMERRLAR